MNWKKYSWLVGILFILYGLLGLVNSKCQALLGGLIGPHYWECNWFIFKFQILPELVSIYGLSLIVSIIIGLVFLIFWYKKWKIRKK
jgi:hypothetical protein